MYTRAQKESFSTSPTSIHKKSNNSESSHSFSVQRQPEINSSQDKERPKYSRDAADLLAANVMRSMQAREQGEEAQGHKGQEESGAASVAQVVMPKPELPIAPVASVSQPLGEMGIQRQCSECEQGMEFGKDSDEMSLEAGVQAKLTVGAVGDKYEQEADRVAAQVMRMSIPPDHSPQVQRFGEEDNPVMRWSLAQSITPLVQRRVDEQVQMHQLVQRAFQAVGNQASGDLESRLHASKGGGSALAPEVRAFMEPRFGADFSSVRVHTGGEAVQMNRELGAQAFAHGSDVYFGAGKSPGNNELTAHELTHVVQQTGGVQLKHIVSPESDAENSLIQRQAKSPFSRESRRQGAIAIAEQGTPLKKSVEITHWTSEEEKREFIQDYLEYTQDKPKLKQQYDEAVAAYPDEAQAVETKRVAKLKADYQAALELNDWDRTAVLLNGFNDQDILTRLKLLTPDKLRLLDEAALRAMKGWSDRVHLPIKNILQASENSEPSTPVTDDNAPRGGSRGSFAPPTPEQMDKMSKRKREKWQGWLDTREPKAQEFGAADYEDYVTNMLVSGGSVFGKQIPAQHPVHPLFLDRLEAASKTAQAAMGSKDFGIKGFGGQDNRPGNHAWGLAIDIDSAANPYVINESGEQAIDELVEPVYERIAQALLHRSSVLTRHVPGKGKDPGKPTGLKGATYTQVAEESDAMVAYFSVLAKPEDAAPPESASTKGKKAPKPLPPPRKLTNRQFDPADLAKLDKDQVRADYDLLIGKNVAKKVDGDFPFVGGGPGQDRDPARGFLSIREEVIKALRSEKLRWGATDFEGASGDVMHVDDGNHHADYIEYGKKNPTQRKKNLFSGVP